MGYFEQIDTSKLNWKTDGEIRRVNGGLTLVPHINGTDDDLYKAIIDEVLALDWKHYKLYLVGGVLEGWQTHDIDICVTGEIDDDLIPLMEAVEKLGCIDIYYVKSYDEINHDVFVKGAQECDYYTCEIYPENRVRFIDVIQRRIDFPAEYGYGLVANKWLLQTFSGSIGIIGAGSKLNIIKNLMEAPQYQEYLGLEKFEDYISLPQKFACDDLVATENMVAEQLKKSTSKIFLMGMGHVKSGLIHRLSKYRDAVFLDVGASIDALAGIIDVDRPYAGDWTNYQIDEPELYDDVDFLAYEGQGKHITLSRE